MNQPPSEGLRLQSSVFLRWAQEELTEDMYRLTVTLLRIPPARGRPSL